MEKPQSFLSVPNAIIVGSLIIAVAILISGGIIKIGGKTAGTVANAPAPSPTAQQPQQPQQPTATIAQIKDTFNKAQIKFGDANKKLVILEVADPSCPYCSIAAGENAELNKQAGDRFKLVADGGTYVAPVPEIKKQSPYQVLKIGLKKSPNQLRQLINQRLDKTLKKGLIKEVKKLRKKGLSWKRLEELGLEYRLAANYLRGLIPYSLMIEQMQKEIYHLAKRQITWFKRDKSIHWVKTENQARSLANKFLLL